MKKGDYVMLREYSWKAFEATGDIIAYMLYKEVQDTPFITAEQVENSIISCRKL